MGNDWNEHNAEQHQSVGADGESLWIFVISSVAVPASNDKRTFLLMREPHYSGSGSGQGIEEEKQKLLQV